MLLLLIAPMLIGIRRVRNLPREADESEAERGEAERNEVEREEEERG